MSTQYKSSIDVPTEILAARLNELADVVAQKRDRIGAEFTMRIPAECDRDADLVMSEAARRLSAAPAVQGEPVAHLRRDQLQQIKTRGPVVGEISPSPRGDMVAVYTAPQPAEQQPEPDVAGLMGVLGQYFDAMDSIGREGTATSTLIAEAECDEAEARLRLFLAAHHNGGES